MEEVPKILEDRRTMYGDHIFKEIAEVWGKYLNLELNSLDVCIMMIQFKIERYSNSAKSGSDEGIADSINDILGYATLLKRQYQELTNDYNHID